MTLNEVRACIRSILLEVIDQDDLNKVIGKIMQSEPLTEVDIAVFAEMTIENIADDNPEYKIDDELIEGGWRFLNFLTQPTRGRSNRQPLVTRLKSTCEKLGNERKRSSNAIDWAFSEEVDHKITEFLLYRVEDIANAIVYGYNNDSVIALQSLRQGKLDHIRSIQDLYKLAEPPESTDDNFSKKTAPAIKAASPGR